MKSAIELFVSEKVKKLRLAKGWTFRYLGDCMDVDQSFIAHVEDPESDKAFNLDHINALAKIFECSIWNLIPQYPLDD